MKKVCGFLPRGSTASAEAAKDRSPAAVSEKRMLEISKLGIDHEKKGSIIVRFARKVRIKNGKPPGQRKERQPHTRRAQINSRGCCGGGGGDAFTDKRWEKVAL